MTFQKTKRHVDFTQSQCSIFFNLMFFVFRFKLIQLLLVVGPANFCCLFLASLSRRPQLSTGYLRDKKFYKVGCVHTKLVCVVNVLDNNYISLYGTDQILFLFTVAVCGEI